MGKLFIIALILVVTFTILISRFISNKLVEKHVEPIKDLHELEQDAEFRTQAYKETVSQIEATAEKVEQIKQKTNIN